MLFDPTDRLYKGTIVGIHGHAMSGLWFLQFEDGKSCGIESGYGVRNLAACFDAKEGSGDLMSKIHGKEIYYLTDALGVMCAFTPVDQAPQEMIDYYDNQKEEEN